MYLYEDAAKAYTYLLKENTIPTLRFVRIDLNAKSYFRVILTLRLLKQITSKGQVTLKMITKILMSKSRLLGIKVLGVTTLFCGDLQSILS